MVMAPIMFDDCAQKGTPVGDLGYSVLLYASGISDEIKELALLPA